MQDDITQLIVRLPSGLKDRFERQCDGSMSGQVVALIREWTESREQTIKLMLKPDVRSAIALKAAESGITPELWVALQIQRSLRGRIN